jgi:hypothetical protein
MGVSFGRKIAYASPAGAIGNSTDAETTPPALTTDILTAGGKAVKEESALGG